MLRKQWLVPSSLTMITILAAAVIILAEFGTFGNAQGQTQGNVTAGNVTLTPQQKDAICNPNSPSAKLNPVNTTESKICGIPVTVKPHPSNITSATNTTAGTEAPPSATSIAPSAVPST